MERTFATILDAQPSGEDHGCACTYGATHRRRRVQLQVTRPDGSNTLCLLPAKFNKKLWIRRGGYLIIDQGEQGGDNRVTGTITAVLYEPDVRALKKLPGVW